VHTSCWQAGRPGPAAGATHPLTNTTARPTGPAALLALPFPKHTEAELQIKFTLCSQQELILIKRPGQTQ